MPICPACKAEYREGFSTCADCGEALVDTLPDNPTEEWVSVEYTLLCSIADDINADILIAALKESEIPVFPKKRGAGSYLTIYMGMNAFGVDIYVPQDMTLRAQDILNGILPGNSNQESEPDEELQAELSRATRNKRIKGWLIFAVWGGLALIAYLIGLMARMVRLLF